MGYSVPGEVFYVRKPYGENVYDRMDDICKLRYLACNGSLSASLYLYDYYDEDRDSDQRFKYACYAAMAGDRDVIGRMVVTHRRLEGFYPEDIVLIGPFERDHGYHGYLSVFSQTAPLFGEIERAFIPMEVREEDLIDGRYPYSHCDSFFVRGEWPYGGDIDRRLDGEPYSDYYRGTEDGRFCIDVFRYFGIATERDEDAAMRDLLDMAENGSTLAMAMISYAIGYERDTMRLRLPDHPTDDGPEPSDDPTPYGVAGRNMLEDSAEWNLLMMFAYIDGCGNTYDRNRLDQEGYEDDVLCIRPDDDSMYGAPTFVFKPSRYKMGWYRDAWRDAEQSEKLTVGEIRKVMRLCIEHIAYGREIPKGTTKELVALPMHLYDPPEDIADALQEMAKRAPCNMLELESAFHVQTFDPRHAGEAERMALEIIRGMRGRLLHEDDPTIRSLGADDARRTYLDAMKSSTPQQIVRRKRLFRMIYGEDLILDGDGCE